MLSASLNKKISFLPSFTTHLSCAQADSKTRTVYMTIALATVTLWSVELIVVGGFSGFFLVCVCVVVVVLEGLFVVLFFVCVWVWLLLFFFFVFLGGVYFFWGEGSLVLDAVLF